MHDAPKRLPIASMGGWMDDDDRRLWRVRITLTCFPSWIVVLETNSEDEEKGEEWYSSWVTCVRPSEK